MASVKSPIYMYMICIPHNIYVIINVLSYSSYYYNGTKCMPLHLCNKEPNLLLLCILVVLHLYNKEPTLQRTSTVIFGSGWSASPREDRPHFKSERLEMRTVRPGGKMAINSVRQFSTSPILTRY